jgi:hypothetical protein
MRTNDNDKSFEEINNKSTKRKVAFGHVLENHETKALLIDCNLNLFERSGCSLVLAS